MGNCKAAVHGGVILIVALVSAMTAGRPLQAAADKYAITDIGFYGLPFIPAALSDTGVVAGKKDFTSAAIWQDTQLTVLTMPNPNTESKAFAVAGMANTPLRVVGSAKTSQVQDGFLTTDGTTQTLGINGGVAHAVNTSGQVAVGDGRAAIWSGGTTTYLSAGNDSGSPTDINASGQVTGQAAHAGDPITHAVLWSSGTEAALDAPVGGGKTAALALNDNAVVVGFTGSESTPLPARWQGVTLTSLPVLTGGHGTARDINNAGDIVGECDLPSTATHGVIWSGGMVIDLNNRIEAASGWTITNALAINNQGWILCLGELAGTAHSCLLKPQTIPPGPKPDLLGKWGAATVKKSRGAISLTGKLTVQNKGQGAAGAFQVSVFVSVDKVYQQGQDGPLVVSQGNTTVPVVLNVAALAKNAKQVLTLPTVPLTAENYAMLKGKYLLAVLDSGTAVEETNEQNNLLVSKKLK